jgi:hypothetical protein
MADNKASNQFLVIQVYMDNKVNKVNMAKFKIIKPKTMGIGPCPRFQHSINFIKESSLVSIYGGRNDHLKDNVILSDLWVIKLYNMEWLRVKIGGFSLPQPRCNHSAFSCNSQIIIFGG